VGIDVRPHPASPRAEGARERVSSEVGVPSTAAAASSGAVLCRPPWLDALPRARAVGTFEALVGASFDEGVNALCWPRRLDGDFAALARALAPTDGLVAVEPAALRRLRLGPAARAAAAAILDDVERLDALGLDPVVNCIAAYPRDERGLPIATDVMSFHVDRAPVCVDTWLCTYHGASTEAVDNELVRRRIDDPTVRGALRAAAGFHDDDDEFAAFVAEGSFDLHYAALDGASPCPLGVGHLWRIAVAWPGAPAPPCVHRAPATRPGDEPRLLLLC
jgi:hypothetical protein